MSADGSTINKITMMTINTAGGYDNPALLEENVGNSEPKYGAVLNSPNKDRTNPVHSPPGYLYNKSSINEKSDTNNITISEKPPKSMLEYDPHQHRNIKNATTYFDTVVHMLKSSLGTGILAMPNAFYNAGYLVGLIGTLLIGFLCTYNIHTLVSCEYELCRRKKVPNMSFSITVQAAFEEGPNSLRWFAPWGRFITNMFLVMFQVGTSSIYLVFMCSNIQDVYQTYYGPISIRLIMIYLLTPFILICWIRNLKLLVPFSTCANIATVLSFVLILYYMFTDLPSLTNRQPVGNYHGIPMFFGTVLFAMEAIGVVMPLKNEMKTPQKFSSMFGVLNASMLPISLLYAIIGFFGYLKYGSETKPSITLNLPSEIPAQLVKILYSASIYITYALSCYVAYDIIWTNGIKFKISEDRYKIFWEYMVRTGIVLVTFLLAILIPNLDLFIALIGALCLSTIGVAIPTILQMLVFWNYYKSKFQFSLFVVKNITVLLIAFLAFVIGVSSSLIEIIKKY